MNHRVYLGLGSNLGDRQANLLRAIDLLAPEIALIRSSSIYETAPWGFREQPAFLNCVVEVETTLSPVKCLAKCKSIETTLGRQPTFRYGPRKIDVDILLYDDRVIRSGQVIIPHPRMLERAFVLVPLAEIAGNVNHPLSKKTVGELLKSIDSTGVERHHERDGKG